MNYWIVAATLVAVGYVFAKQNAGIQGKGHEFVYVFSNTCGFCKKFKPVWNAAKAKHAKPGVRFSDRESSANNDFINQHRVRGYPTVIHFFNGQEVDRTSGFVELPAFETFLLK